MSINEQSMSVSMDIESYDTQEEENRIYLALEMSEEDIHKRMAELCADTPVTEENPMLRRRDLNLGQLPKEDSQETSQESKSQAAPPISQKDVERMEAAQAKRERKKAKRKQLANKE
jgi:KaiC/GvpD/RAD55 family RecA-like ATPase